MRVSGFDGLPAVPPLLDDPVPQAVQGVVDEVGDRVEGRFEKLCGQGVVGRVSLTVAPSPPLVPPPPLPPPDMLTPVASVAGGGENTVAVAVAVTVAVAVEARTRSRMAWRGSPRGCDHS